MKTTLEIPDSVFRRAKARAAERHVPLRQLISEAVVEKLDAESRAGSRGRTALAGKLRHVRKESARINGLIERFFNRKSTIPKALIAVLPDAARFAALSTQTILTAPAAATRRQSNDRPGARTPLESVLSDVGRQR